MKLKELYSYLESVIPPSFQESYDNSGLQIGDPEAEIDSALLSLDINGEVIEEALSSGTRLIITHHPLIFKPLKSLTGRSLTEELVIKAIKNEISIYSSHTNLDIIRGGVSYRMAEKMALQDIAALVPLEGKLIKLVVFVPESHASLVRDAMFNAGAGYIGNYDRCSFYLPGKGTFRAGPGTDPYSGKKGEESTKEEIRIETILPDHIKHNIIKAMIESHPYEEVAYDLYRLENEIPGAGLGCIGYLPESLKDDEFIEYTARVFDAEAIRHTGIKGKEIKKVAVMGGSGGSFINKALSAGADAYISGDIKYHSFFEGKDMLIADIGHYESEKPSLEILYELITKKFPKFAVRFSEINTNPVNYFQAWKK